MSQRTLAARWGANGLPQELTQKITFADCGADGIVTEIPLLDANGDDFAMPAGTNVAVETWVKTVFNSGTTDVITVGDGTTVDAYLAAGDIDEHAAGNKARNAVEHETATVTPTVTITRTGAAPTTGEIYVVWTLTPCQFATD